MPPGQAAPPIVKGFSGAPARAWPEGKAEAVKLVGETWTEGEHTAGWDWFQERFSALSANVSRVVVAPERTIHQALLGLFAQGHVLLEDLPGVGKTLLAKTIAGCVEGSFSHIQFTPDLLPTDITGTSVVDLRNNHFEFIPGPIFANVVLADELNRTGPRTQSTLLEAMGEQQVTVDGSSRRLSRPFMVIATQNVAESHGTFPLPNSQMDRFLVSMSIGLPAAEQQLEILDRSEHGLPEASPVVSVDDVVAMQDMVRQVKAVLPVKEYIVNVVAATREHPAVDAGVSPRGAVGLLRAAQGWAAFQGRDFVVPEDVKTLAPAVLCHRITVDPSSGVAARSVVGELLASVPVPL